MTVLFTDPVFLEHETTPGHPERPERLRAIRQYLSDQKLDQRCHTGQTRAATVAEIARVHQRQHIQIVEQACRHEVPLDGDTPVVKASYKAALTGAGATMNAIDSVLDNQDTNALCLVRPPGHHATPSRSMGFCLFNSIAVGARHALAARGLARVMIVDFDVHHGNGTQDAFYDDASVFFLSMHRYPFYPGTGAAHETGAGAGQGTTKNLPIRYGTPRDQIVDVFRTAVTAAADEFQPKLLMVSAGFDGHAADPIGSLNLETEDFGTLTEVLTEVARQHTQGRLVSVLEGGYNLKALAESVGAHLSSLLASLPPS